jgi:hypothetical protein
MHVSMICATTERDTYEDPNTFFALIAVEAADPSLMTGKGIACFRDNVYFDGIADLG